MNKWDTRLQLKRRIHGRIWMKATPPPLEPPWTKAREYPILWDIYIYNIQHSLSYLIQYIMPVQVFYNVIDYFGIFNLCLITTIIIVIANCYFSNVHVTKWALIWQKQLLKYVYNRLRIATRGLHISNFSWGEGEGGGIPRKAIGALGDTHYNSHPEISNPPFKNPIDWHIVMVCSIRAGYR